MPRGRCWTPSSSPLRAVHGDGSRGFPDGAPHDQVIATCGLSVPYAWPGQSRPGGRIVAPWGDAVRQRRRRGPAGRLPRRPERVGDFHRAGEVHEAAGSAPAAVVHSAYVAAAWPTVASRAHRPRRRRSPGSGSARGGLRSGSASRTVCVVRRG
ncbi:hypothetical protein ACLIYP_05175 [Streptomyces nanhaiensis]|uniref:hypothetical protein n=1 Tax=Streptomyces nanhaiensis TaxID=679319 RepID=UPI00399C9C5E